MSFRRVWQNRSSIGAEQFDREVHRYGRLYLLMRADKRFRCPNYHFDTGACQPSCDICMGSGYIHGYELHKMYKSMNQTTVYNAPDFIAYIFYMKQDVEAKSEDHILEVRLDNNNRVIEVVKEFEIKDTTVRHFGEDQAYSMASAVEVDLTSNNKLVRYLQDITAHGVSDDAI